MTTEAVRLQAPRPRYCPPHQSGITDPKWPSETPAGVDEKLYSRYRDRLAPQDFATIVRADILAQDREELRLILRKLSAFGNLQMARKPNFGGILPLVFQKLPDSYRVTVTIGFGASLFTTLSGDDRFGLRHLQPTALRVMPRFLGDVRGFEPEADATDVIVLIGSDHPYINVTIARKLAQWLDPRFVVRSIEQGFSRPDEKEWLRFDDGISNLQGADMDRLVYVANSDDEPGWCTNGSYLVYRKICENLGAWDGLRSLERWEEGGLDQRRLDRWKAKGRERPNTEHLPSHAIGQELAIGRWKDSGAPLSRHLNRENSDLPAYPDATNPDDGPWNAHMRKVQPRRSDADLFGVFDLDRRFLRRPHPFFTGGSAKDLQVGLHFIGFMRNIRAQFEHVVQMWQTNPDFPTRGAGVDALYHFGVLSTVSGGYYFCAPVRGDEFRPRDTADIERSEDYEGDKRAFIGDGLFR